MGSPYVSEGGVYGPNKYQNTEILESENKCEKDFPFQELLTVCLSSVSPECLLGSLPSGSEAKYSSIRAYEDGFSFTTTELHVGVQM